MLVVYGLLQCLISRGGDFHDGRANTEAGTALTAALVVLSTFAVVATSYGSPIPILTYHYNNSRTGANTSETILTPANVNVNQFGKLFSIPLNGVTFAQPLYVPNLQIPGLGTHNVVYLATQHNWLYAFDADNGATLWSIKVG